MKDFVTMGFNPLQKEKMCHTYGTRDDGEFLYRWAKATAL